MKHMTFWLLIALVMMGLQINSQTNVFSLEDRVPEKTLIYCSFPDIDRAMQAFQKTSLWQLLQDQEVKTFIQSVMDTLAPEVQKYLPEIERELGINPVELAKIFRGGVSIAVVDFEPPTIALSITFGDQRALVDQFLEKNKSKVPFEEREYKGRKIYALAEIPEPGVAFTFVDDTIIFCSNLELLDQICNKTNLSSLRASSDFQKAKERVQKNYTPAFLFYVALKEIRSKVESQIPPDVKQILTDLGIFDISNVAFGLNFHDNYVHDAIFIGIEGKPRGIVAMLQQPPVSLDGVKELPANTTAFAAFQFDLGEFIQQAEKIVSLLPDGDEMLGEYQKVCKQMEEKLGFSIQKDISAFLGTDHCFFKYISPQENLFAYMGSVSTLKNPDLFLKWLANVCNFLQLDIKKLNYSGREIHYLSRKLAPLGNNPFENLEDMDRKGENEQIIVNVLSYLASGCTFFIEKDKLYTAPSMHTMKHFLNTRNNTSKLENVPAFREFLSKYIPTNASFVAYLDIRTGLNLWWDTLLPVAGIFEGYMRAAGIPFDKALIPTGETITRYLVPSCMSYSSDRDGVLFQSYSVIGRGVYIFGLLGIGAAIAIDELD